jgi:hypothetical protein
VSTPIKCVDISQIKRNKVVPVKSGDDGPTDKQLSIAFEMIQMKI